jgi:DegV family protein with EDD domain
MATVKIVTDSVATLPQELERELEITVVPANVVFGQEVFRDGVDLPPKAFYARLAASSVLPTTAVPPPGVFEAVYRRLGRETRYVVSIHIPAGLSGMINAAQIAAQALPELEIAVVDGGNISMALGWLVVIAARAAKAGQTFEQVLALVQETIPRLRLVAMLDTLEYVRRGGRISPPQAWLGTLLNIKPLIEIREGEVRLLERVRTRRRALQRLVELVAESGPAEEMAVIQANAPDVAEELRQMLGKLHPLDRIPITEAGPVLVTHAGPGAVGVAWVVADDA